MQRSLGPVFIVGSSRSGTTFVARILGQSDKIFVAEETHFFDRLVPEKLNDLDEVKIFELMQEMEAIQLHGINRRRTSTKGPLLQTLTVERVREMNASQFFEESLRCFADEAVELIVDQTPGHVHHIDQIIRLFPNAKIINMVRDPRAVVLSQRGKWRASQRLNQPRHEVFRSIFNYHPVTMALLWNRSISAGVDATERHKRDRILTIYFERFMAEPSVTLGTISDFLSIELDDTMLDVPVGVSSNGRVEGAPERGVNASVTDQWRSRLSVAEIYLVQRIAGRHMKNIGYGSVEARPTFAVLLIVIWFPIHLAVAFLLNLRRVGNPLQSLMTRAGLRRASSLSE